MGGSNPEWQGFPHGSVVKNPSAMQEMGVRSLGWEYPLAEDVATHSSILARKTPRTEEPGRLWSTCSQRQTQQKRVSSPSSSLPGGGGSCLQWQTAPPPTCGPPPCCTCSLCHSLTLHHCFRAFFYAIHFLLSAFILGLMVSPFKCSSALSLV